MAKLTFDFCEKEVFLKISPKLATKIGLNEAIALQQIHYWLHPERNKNLRDGRYWVYNTIQQWQIQFPFWSINTIKKTLSSLEEKQLILRENLNPNKFARVLWYTIDYEKLSMLQQSPNEECKLHPSKSSKCAHRLEQIKPIEELNLSSSYIEAKNTSENTTKNTLSPPSLTVSVAEAPSPDEREKNNKAQEMMEIFSETVLGGQRLKLNPTRIDQFCQVLTEQLDGNMENWETLCQNIIRSKFLMGESPKSNFKASLDWVLKDHNATKILEGNYGVGDREAAIKRDLETVTASIGSRTEPELMKKLRYWFIRFYGKADYASWFEQAEFVSFDENCLVLQVPSQFVKDWLGTNYLIDMREYLKEEHQKPIQIAYIVAATKQSPEHQSDLPPPPDASLLAKGAKSKVGQVIREVTAHLTNNNPKPKRKK